MNKVSEWFLHIKLIEPVKNSSNSSYLILESSCLELETTLGVTDKFLNGLGIELDEQYPVNMSNLILTEFIENR